MSIELVRKDCVLSDVVTAFQRDDKLDGTTKRYIIRIERVFFFFLPFFFFSNFHAFNFSIVCIKAIAIVLSSNSGEKSIDGSRKVFFFPIYIYIGPFQF